MAKSGRAKCKLSRSDFAGISEWQSLGYAHGRQAAALADQDIADLAAYYAAQTPARRTADPALAEAGERLYRGGNSNMKSVHVWHAMARPAAAHPLATRRWPGQHATYTVKQLNDYTERRPQE